MSAHMTLRDLYLPADRIPDLPAARTKATTLCRNASIEDLRALLDNDWIGHPSLYDYEVSDEQIRPHLAELRAAAEPRLHELLAAFMTSLGERDVARFPYDRTPGENRGHTIDVYVTGGVTPATPRPTASRHGTSCTPPTSSPPAGASSSAPRSGCYTP